MRAGISSGVCKTSGAKTVSHKPDENFHHPDNKTLEHEGWTKLIEKKRGCTDCLCLLLLIASWICMTAVGFVACGVVKDVNLPAGNPRRLMNAVDYQGRVCGYDGLKSKPLGYYLMDQTAVCVSSCPEKTNLLKFICQYDIQHLADQSVVVGDGYVASKKCMYEIQSTTALGRCSPMKVSTNTTLHLDQYKGYTSSSSGWFNTFFGDVMYLRGIIFGFGIGLSTVVAFVYLYMLRLPGLLFVTIWTLIFSIEIFLFVGAFLLWSLSNTWAHDGVHVYAESMGMAILSYIFMACAVLYFCLILVLRSRVQLAIGVIKEAAKALASIPILILTPIFQVIAITIFLVPWIIYVIFLASSGEMVNHTGSAVDATTGLSESYSYRTFEYTTNTKYAFLYMLFCWFWTSEFVVACGQLVISLALSDWYFTQDKTTVGNQSAFWAMGTTCRYHLGTAAFGSLIIAIIKTIRAVIAYLQRKAKQSGNKIAQYLLCVLQCCMWCLEKVMKFLNKNAYIQTAIYGTSFCKSARKAFFLLLRNILRVMAVNMVAEFVLFIGKLFVPVVTVFATYLVIAYAYPSDQINGIISPLIFVAVLSYFVSSMFSEIFGMSIETILCCFIADEEMFSPEKRFAEGPLRTTLQETAQAAAEAKAKNMKIAPEPTPQSPRGGVL